MRKGKVENPRVAFANLSLKDSDVGQNLSENEGSHHERASSAKSAERVFEPDSVFDEQKDTRDPFAGACAPDSTLERQKELLSSGCLQHISGTFDTYKCMDCETIFYGYKRGDPKMSEHIRVGKGKCRYVRAVFGGREKELLVLRGKIRFQQGYMALPEYALYAEEKFVCVDGVERCVVCTQPSTEAHFLACEYVCKRLVASLKHLQVNAREDDVPLFPPVSQRGKETGKQTQFCSARDFSVLGESANMVHFADTVDSHFCNACNILLKHFVRGDTLLGEHVYHAHIRGVTCSYLKLRFEHREQELQRMIAHERYRKGYLAYPEDFVQAKQGFVKVHGVNVCVICGTPANQGRSLPPMGHGNKCSEMTKSLLRTMKNMKFIIA